MKHFKIIFAMTLAILLSGTAVKAQSWEEGKVVITAGYGFPNLGKSLLKTLQNNSNSNGTSTGDLKITGFGPLHIKGEYAITSKVGFGLSANYVQFGGKWSNTSTSQDAFGNTVTTVYNYDADASSLSLNARFNIHFGTTDKVDPYWGIGAGYRTNHYSVKTNDPGYNQNSNVTLFPVGFETTVGVRYYFTKNIGAYTELGISKSVIQAGLVAKF